MRPYTPSVDPDDEDEYCDSALTLGIGINIATQASDGTAMSPLSGSFTLTCNDGTRSGDINVNVLSSAGTIENQLVEECPGLREQIDVSEVNSYFYVNNGRHIRIKFLKSYDYAQFEIQNPMISPNGVTY